MEPLPPWLCPTSLHIHVELCRIQSISGGNMQNPLSTWSCLGSWICFGISWPSSFLIFISTFQYSIKSLVTGLHRTFFGVIPHINVSFYRNRFHTTRKCICSFNPKINGDFRTIIHAAALGSGYETWTNENLRLSPTCLRENLF